MLSLKSNRKNTGKVGNMMNFFGKKNGRFGEEEDFYEATMESNDSLEEVEDTEETPVNTSTQKEENAGVGVGIGGSGLELKVVHSEKYEDVVGVAEHLLDHCTVVLDLNAANKDVRRRILDFLTGVAFAIGGLVRRVTDNTYIITPSNVDVSESHIPTSMSEAE